ERPKKPADSTAANERQSLLELSQSPPLKREKTECAQCAGKGDLETRQQPGRTLLLKGLPPRSSQTRLIQRHTDGKKRVGVHHRVRPKDVPSDVFGHEVDEDDPGHEDER